MNFQNVKQTWQNSSHDLFPKEVFLVAFRWKLISWKGFFWLLLSGNKFPEKVFLSVFKWKSIVRELLQFWRIRCSHPDLLPWTLNREMQPQTCQGRSGAHNTYYYVCMYYIVFFISDFWGYQDNNSRNGCQKTLNACSCFHPDLLPWTERLLPNATTDMPGKKCT